MCHRELAQNAALAMPVRMGPACDSSVRHHLKAPPSNVTLHGHRETPWVCSHHRLRHSQRPCNLGGPCHAVRLLRKKCLIRATTALHSRLLKQSGARRDVTSFSESTKSRPWWLKCFHLRMQQPKYSLLLTLLVSLSNPTQQCLHSKFLNSTLLRALKGTTGLQHFASPSCVSLTSVKLPSA